MQPSAVCGRQFLHDCDERCIRQLSLTLHHEREPDFEALDEEDPVRCFGTNDVPVLRAAISTPAATALVARRSPMRVTLDLDDPW